MLDNNNQQNGQGNNNQQQSEKKIKFKEPKIKWKVSKARVILYQDLAEGKIPRHATDQYGKSTMKLEVIFQMHGEYKLYDREKFSSRLSKVRDMYDDCMHRKSMDEEAFNTFLHNHNPSLFSHQGYPEWQGSDAQSLLRDDIEANKHNGMSKIDLWESRAEYFEDFPLSVFRDKIKQEIRTAKYLHTCREKGKLHVAS
jgi:hypothetical protein